MGYDKGTSHAPQKRWSNLVSPQNTVAPPDPFAARRLLNELNDLQQDQEDTVYSSYDDEHLWIR